MRPVQSQDTRSLAITIQHPRASPVAQGFTTHLAMQRTQVRSLLGGVSSHVLRGNQAQAPQLERPWTTVKDPSPCNEDLVCYN